MFPKKNRLKKRKEFQFVFENGIFFEGKLVKMKVIFNNQEEKKFAVVAPIKIFKKAVERNKIKRKLREAVRNIFFQIPEKIAFILIARKDILEKSVKQIEEDIKEILLIIKNQNDS